MCSGAWCCTRARRPQVSSVRLYYLPKNVAPEVDDVTVQMAETTERDPSRSRQFDRLPRRPGHSNVLVRWTAHDENGDQLRFSIYYRGDGDTRWLLLKDDLNERSYVFDPKPDSRRRIHLPRCRLRRAFAPAERSAYRLEG